MRKIIALVMVLSISILSLVSCEVIDSIKDKMLDDGTSHVEDNTFDDELMYMKDHMSMLEELESDDIAEVAIHNISYCSPGNLNSVYRSTDRNTISSFLDKCKSTTVTYATLEDTLVAGGGGRKIVFVLNDGTKKTIYISNKVIYLSNGVNLKVEEYPAFDKDSDVYDVSNTFVTEKKEYEIYERDATGNRTLIGKSTGIDKLEFVRCTGDNYKDVIPTHYFLFDYIYDMCIVSDRVFYVEEYGVKRFYELTSQKSFYEIIEEATGEQ